MAFSPGSHLGSLYEVTALIGQGGMGEVALKVLPHAFADDHELRQRFEREAKAISSLNHPHICTLYDRRARPIRG